MSRTGKHTIMIQSCHLTSFNDRTSWCLIFPLACKCLKFIDHHFFSSQQEENRFSRTWNNLETCHFGLLGLHFCGGVDYKILTLVSFYFGRKPIWANPMSTLAGTECGLWRSKRLSGGLETVGIVLSIAICANVSKWESQGLDIITHTLSELFHHMNHMSIVTFLARFEGYFSVIRQCHHQCIVYRLPYMTPKECERHIFESYVLFSMDGSVSLSLSFLKLQSTSPQGERTKSHMILLWWLLIFDKIKIEAIFLGHRFKKIWVNCWSQRISHWLGEHRLIPFFRQVRPVN